MVADCWQRPIDGYGMFKFIAKLRRLKATLKHWNSECFGNVFRNVSNAEAKVKEREQVFNSFGLQEDHVLLNKAQAALLRVLSEEEDFLHQKSKEKWLVEGDKNTSFFHSTVAEKCNRLIIFRIKDSSGSWIHDEDRMKLEATDFFSTLLTDNGTYF